jgi:hypothetical protein
MPAAAAAVLVSVAVLLPLSRSVTPLGKPVAVIVSVGVPVVVTVNEPAVPAVNVAELLLVIAGAVPTVSVND